MFDMKCANERVIEWCKASSVGIPISDQKDVCIKY